MICIVSAYSLIVLTHTSKVYAVQGQLNYGFAQPTSPQVVIKDTKELDACKKEIDTTKTLLTNCQNTNLLHIETQSELKKQKDVFFLATIISAGITAILGLISLILAIKLRRVLANTSTN